MTNKNSNKLSNKKNNLLSNNIVSFPEIENNELVLCERDNEEIDYIQERDSFKIFYISDLHLSHKIVNKGCKTEDEIKYFIQELIENMFGDLFIPYNSILLIGGDVSSNPRVFYLFVKMLRTFMDENHKYIPIVFILGNHELFELEGYSFDKAVQIYRNTLYENGMHLLQNNIIYIEEQRGVGKILKTINTEDLSKYSKQEMINQFRYARVILFGGLGFAGYNEKYNSTIGLYRNTINREEEIIETKKFELLYNKVSNFLKDKNLIVFTHMPKIDWTNNEQYEENFIYVNGHTHRNIYYDDGVYRVYSDNQVGYKGKKCFIKYFYMDVEYDLFSDYANGIYEITREQYIDFYRGKNIRLQFNRNVNKLYMLKKNGWYCFILQSKNKKLSILNGGALKSLSFNDINYYFNNLEKTIFYLKGPLDKYTIIQNNVSNIIKSIGGSGYIHGAIVDIDYYNHIYINPYDLTITGYWASDIVNKRIYNSIPELLKENCPSLYKKYIKKLKGKVKNDIILLETKKLGLSVPSQVYLDTDMYKESRELKKMQRLHSNILTTWYEPNQKSIGR